MITDKLIPSPFALKVEVHVLEVGYLVEVEGRIRIGCAPVLHRFALGNLTAVDARIHHEVSRFMADVGALVTAAEANDVIAAAAPAGRAEKIARAAALIDRKKWRQELEAHAKDDRPLSAWLEDALRAFLDRLDAC